MNRNQICQEILEDNAHPNVEVLEIVEKQCKPFYGKISVRFQQDGVEQNREFLVKYPEKYCNETKPRLFNRSNEKEKSIHSILDEFRKITGTNYGKELKYFSEKFVIYYVDPKLRKAIHNTDEQFKYGLIELAKFHVASIIYIKSVSEDGSKLSNMKGLNEDPLSLKNIGDYSGIIFTHVQQIRREFPNTFLDDLSQQQICKEISNIVETIQNSNFMKILILGDFSHENLFLNTYGNILDFSCAAYNFPIFDVIQFISSFPTSTKNLKSFEEGANLYLEILGKEMKNYNLEIENILPAENFMKVYKLLVSLLKLVMNSRSLNEKSTNDSASILLEILSTLKLSPVLAEQQEISFEDCYSVFKKISTRNYKLTSYKTTPQRVKNGFLGEHHDMQIEVEIQGEKHTYSLFLKGIPHTKALEEFEKSVGSFFKETMFYTKYIPLLKEHNIHILDDEVPTCYFADENKYIVLENLAIKGFSILSPRNPPDHDVVQEVLKILAKLHASCIILEEFMGKKYGKTYRLIDDFRREFNEPFYSSVPVIESHRNSGKFGMEALAEIVDFEDDVDRDEFKRLAVNACHQQNDFAKPSNVWRNTLCHADFWTKNFMVKYCDNKPNGIVMIDFQTYRYAPPAQDLMAFIYLNSEEQTREKYLNLWLELYYQIFSGYLKKYGIEVTDIFDKTEFYQSCEFYKQFAINQSITHFQIILAPEEFIGPMLLDQKTSRQIFVGSRYNLVKEVWEIDEVYRRRLTEAVILLKNCLMEKSISCS